MRRASSLLRSAVWARAGNGIVFQLGQKPNILSIWRMEGGFSPHRRLRQTAVISTALTDYWRVVQAKP
jgi:hypothetical protein